ncbi:MAG: flagellar basal body protein, partial [Candidatus Margulisiibacteriota bacterium]
MSGIEVAKRSMEAQKYAMDVIGHNIANVNTEGYTRQRAELETTEPVLVAVTNKNKPLASMGTGVKMVAVSRVRDEFLDIQQRNINQDFGSWIQEETNYSIIESIFNEPSDTAISGNLNRFWNGWQALASPDPTSPGARSNLMSQGEVLANSLQQTHKQLQDLQVNTDKDIQLKVNQVNDISQQIANMNANI